ncbi:MAG TPA: CHAD domain-containing protein [Rubrivivax sp.]|nr:CHAD domain-containing protein [Rubrivivax sp.]
METELKFQIPPARSAALRRALATASARSVRLQALYADTADQRLAAAGLALRLRKEGRVWVQTLKGRGDGLMRRLEHEVHLPPQRGVPMLDPQRHAGTPVGELLAVALASGAELRTLYQTDIRRLHRRVRHGGAVIEIAYDHGRIVADGRSVAADEIEFELVSGPPAALPARAARWAARFGLWWDVRTKSERGFRLALGHDQVPAVKANAAALPAVAGPHQAWCTVLQSALAQALPNAAEIAAGTDTPEHLHQLRVALRRLRSALRWFAVWGGDAEAAHALEADWREPFGRLGAARDSDVLVHCLQPALQAAGAPPFDATPAAADGGPGEIVRGVEFPGLLLRTLAITWPPPQPVDDGGSAALDAAARDVLRRAWRRVLKDAQGFGTASVDEQHRMRKRLKRFRYGLEFLMPLLAHKPARRLHRAACTALDALGHLNDLHTAEAYFRTCAQSDARAWFAVGWVAGSQPQARAVAARALARMARLDASPLPWRRRGQRRQRKSSA